MRIQVYREDEIVLDKVRIRSHIDVIRSNWLPNEQEVLLSYLQKTFPGHYKRFNVAGWEAKSRAELGSSDPFAFSNTLPALPFQDLRNFQ